MIHCAQQQATPGVVMQVNTALTAACWQHAVTTARIVQLPLIRLDRQHAYMIWLIHATAAGLAPVQQRHQYPAQHT